MTKQTVYLNNFARKSGFRLQFLKQSALKTLHCWRGLMSVSACISISFKTETERACVVTHKAFGSG